MAKKSCCKKLIYRYIPPTEAGLKYKFWSTAAGPHLDPLEWSGPADTNGFPLPTAAPADFEGISNATNLTDSSVGAGAARYGIVEGWLYMPIDGYIRDNNGNTGELGMVLLGDCCGNLKEGLGANHTVNTSTPDRTVLESTPAKEGWVYVYGPQSDLSAAQGWDFEYSADGVTGWANITQRQPEAPEVECQEISCCAGIPEGWQRKPLADCCDPIYIAPGGESYVENICSDVRMVTNPAIGTSWWASWSPVITTDLATEVIVPWTTIGEATAPSKVSDVELNIEYGNTYLRQRRNRIYMWWDYRILIDGTVVATRTNNRYWYNDELQDTNPDVIDPIDTHIQSIASTVESRLNIPAGSTVSVEGQLRWNVNGSQSSAYARVITGYRSRVTFDFDPIEFLVPA